jgi:DNA-binding transcriptional ArsR family regulator
MRALAHPVRLALIDAIRDEGELTASRAAELLGDSPGNMSWHLQTLAKYGFVEEAGTGKGRSRPWRLIEKVWSFDPGTSEDPEAAAAGDALETALITRSVDQLQAWRRRRSAFPGWAQEAFINNQVSYLTPAELSQLSDDIQALVDRFTARDDPAARPPDAAPVRIFSWGHPLPPPDA